ncbi:hypothetical protein [Leptodesmis sp.]|uniref:hypothetical protein n=1 Tax=Leptodesmis sp. TaxID=3100501 RepID=UPI0040535488
MQCDQIKPGLVKNLQKLHQSSKYMAPALALAAVLSLGMGMGSGKPAIALSFMANQPGFVISAAPAQTVQPPPTLISTLRRSLSKQTGIPAKALQVVESSPKTWPNGCLGLARPDEMCTQVMIPGWRVVFSHGSQRWIYRTDATGKTHRLE